MKKFTAKLQGRVLIGLIFSVLVLTGALLLPPLIRTAKAATSGEYEYTVNTDGTTATITGYSGAGGDITIPYTVTDGTNTYTVTAIGGESFANVEKVISIIIPEGVTSIGQNAFYRCNDLSTISIAASVSDIDINAFNQCYGLSEFTVREDNDNYTSVDGVLFDNSITELIRYPINNPRSSYVIPDTVTTIGDCAFQSSKLSNISLSNNISVIGAHAFQGCTYISNITMPDSIKNIGEYAFNWCTALIEVSIPASVETIGNSAFGECFALKKIDVNDGNLNYASQNGVLFNKGFTHLLQYPLDSPVLSYSIPEGILTVDNMAFRGCRNLSDLNISASIISIYNTNFLNCYKLKSISVAEGNAYYSSQDGILFDKKKTSLIQYPRDHAGTTYSIPNDVTVIYGAAFYECSYLTDITIPDGITEIPGDAFYDCPKLSKVTLPSSIVNIRAYAFAQCIRLKDITLPTGLKTIEPYAFKDCISLTSIVIPASVESIYIGAFKSCKFLLSAYFTGDAPEMGADVFTGCHDGFKVYYAAGKSGYTDPWHGYDVSEYDPAAPVKYHIFGEYDNETYGTVTGGGTYNAGASVTLRAIPKEGYRFVGWAEGGNGRNFSIDENYALTDPVYTFTVNGGGIFTAKFAPIGTPYEIWAANPGGRPTLIWVEVKGASGYEVWRSASSADSNYSCIAQVTSGTTYTMQTGAAYYYKVRAYCTADTTTTYGSLSKSVTTDAIGLKVTAAAAGYNSIKIAWTAIPGVSQYRVFRASSENGSYSLIKTTTALSYNNTGLKTGTNYYYKIQTYSRASRQYSGLSTPASAQPALSSVASASASAYYPTSVKVSWSAVPGKSGYEIWRSTSPDSGFALLKSTGSTSYKDTTCTPFVTYYYQIKAYRTVSGHKVYSASASPTANATPILGNVSGVKAAVSSPSSVKLSWASVTGASGYEVLRSTTIDGGYVAVKSTSSLSFTDSNLVPNTTYYYQVRAYRKVGGSTVPSTPSAPVSATPYFGSVSNAKAVRSSATGIKLTWSAVSGRTGYEIYRGTSPSGDFIFLKLTTSASFTDSGLTTGVTYYYKIVAYRTVNGVKYRSTESVVSATP